MNDDIAPAFAGPLPVGTEIRDGLKPFHCKCGSSEFLQNGQRQLTNLRECRCAKCGASPLE